MVIDFKPMTCPFEKLGIERIKANDDKKEKV